MKTSIFAVSLLVLSLTLAHAGGPVVVAASPVVMATAPVASYDWSGPYLGLGYGSTSADVNFSSTGPFDFDSGSVASIYAGYLFQRGSIVYGGELSYGAVSKTGIVGSLDNEIDRVTDLKGRLGYAMDRFQVYGVVGYSMARYVEPGFSEFKVDGFAYGIGAEYAISTNASIGIDYLARNLSGDSSAVPGTTGDFDLNTVSLRPSFRF